MDSDWFRRLYAYRDHDINLDDEIAYLEAMQYDFEYRQASESREAQALAQALAAVRSARTAADLGIGLTPGASTIHDATVALTGYNVALNERVGWGGRGIALIGAVMPGVSGPSLRVGGTVLREVGEAALHVYRRANGYESASRLARKAAEAQQAIGLHGVSVVARVPPGFSILSGDVTADGS